jgi:hypothetical protein
LQAEQEGEALSRDEAADVEAALLLSLQEQEEAAPDDVDLEAAPSDEEQPEEEEEEKKAAPAAPAGWSIPRNLREPPRMSRRVAVGAAMRLPASVARLQYLQLFRSQKVLTAAKSGPIDPR